MQCSNHFFLKGCELHQLVGIDCQEMHTRIQFSVMEAKEHAFVFVVQRTSFPPLLFPVNTDLESRPYTDSTIDIFSKC